MKFWYMRRTGSMLSSLQPLRTVWAPAPNCVMQEENSPLGFPPNAQTCRFVFLWVCFPSEVEAETLLGYWRRIGKRAWSTWWHFQFCVNISRKIPCFLKLIEEKYRPLSNNNNKKDTEEILAVGTSYHPYIRNSIILHNTLVRESNCLLQGF